MQIKKKMPCLFFKSLFFSPSYIFHLLTAQLRESTKCFFSQASVVSSSIVAAHTKLDVAEEQINLLHLRGFILGVALAAGRGPQHHYAVRQFSPPEPAPFKTCYHNTRILSNSHHQKYAKWQHCTSTVCERLIPPLSAPTWWGWDTAAGPFLVFFFFFSERHLHFFPAGETSSDFLSVIVFPTAAITPLENRPQVTWIPDPLSPGNMWAAICRCG